MENTRFPGRPLRLLWASPFALHDISSGAAMQCRIILQKLRERGLEIRVLGGLIFDNPRGAAMFNGLEEHRKSGRPFFSIRDHDIDYLYVNAASTSASAHTAAEQDVLFGRYVAILDEFMPDIVLGYGGDMLSMTMRREAHRRGIAVVYMLCNGNHQNFSFPDTDLVLTDSQATASWYAGKFGVNVRTMGEFILPEMVVAEQREPKYVTLVNPHPSKGVSIFARLALMAREELPETEFLVVQSRGSFAESVLALHEPGDKEARPLKPDMFPNVSLAQHTPNMKAVYAVTRALLAPSLWFESWGRVATEAVMNGIPVLASTSGGLPEAVGEGGICVAAPQAWHDDHLLLPTEEEVRPWMDALKRLLDEDWSEACARAAARHDVEARTDALLALLQDLIMRRPSLSPQYLRA